MLPLKTSCPCKPEIGALLVLILTGSMQHDLPRVDLKSRALSSQKYAEMGRWWFAGQTGESCCSKDINLSGVQHKRRRSWGDFWTSFQVMPLKREQKNLGFRSTGKPVYLNHGEWELLGRWASKRSTPYTKKYLQLNFYLQMKWLVSTFRIWELVMFYFLLESQPALSKKFYYNK